MSPFRDGSGDPRSMKKIVLTANFQRYQNWCREHGLNPRTQAIFARTSYELRGARLEQIVVEPGWSQGRSPANVESIRNQLAFLQALA